MKADAIPVRPVTDTPPETLPPESRTDAEDYKSARWLVSTANDVQKRGEYLFVHFAGRNAKIYRLKCLSGKAAKRTQMLLRRDLRDTKTDGQYNDVLSAFLAEIQMVAMTVAAAAEPAQPATPAEPQEVVEGDDQIVTRHVHDCTPGRVALPCQYDWTAHLQSTSCPCGPLVDATNVELTKTLFVVHRGCE